MLARCMVRNDEKTVRPGLTGVTSGFADSRRPAPVSPPFIYRHPFEDLGDPTDFCGRADSFRYNLFRSFSARAY